MGMKKSQVALTEHMTEKTTFTLLVQTWNAASEYHPPESL
jgi:hypothetical protein